MFSLVRCVAFDAVGTLIYPDPPVAEVYARLGRKHGSRVSEEETRLRFREAFRIEYDTSLSTNEREERQKWRRIVQKVMDLEDSEACFEELFAHFGRADSWRCFSDGADTLRDLSARGFDLVLASNFDHRLHAVCAGHAELRGICKRVISSEVGRFKPNPAFFEALVNIAGVKKDEVLMVGDDWKNDVAGAMKFGLQAVYLDRAQAEPLSRKENAITISTLAELRDLLP